MRVLCVNSLWSLSLFVMIGLVCAAAVPADAAPPTPPMPTFADVSYGPHPHELVDIFLPADNKGPFPVLLWFGTIWQPGKHQEGVSVMLPNHCAVVAVETRTMTDAQADKDPVPVSYVCLDAVRVTQWVRLHAKDYNFDPDHIATGGSSQAGIPALFVALTPDKANPAAADPLERMSTRICGVLCHRCQPSIDPKQMQEWVPGVKWGAPALNCGFDESLAKRDQLLPIIQQYSPDALISPSGPPVYFYNNWGLTKPDDINEVDYRIHSPLWGLGFQSKAQSKGMTVYCDYPGHHAEKYKNGWDFLLHQLTTVR